MLDELYFKPVNYLVIYKHICNSVLEFLCGRIVSMFRALRHSLPHDDKLWIDWTSVLQAGRSSLWSYEPDPEFSGGQCKASIPVLTSAVKAISREMSREQIC